MEYGSETKDYLTKDNCPMSQSNSIDTIKAQEILEDYLVGKDSNFTEIFKFIFAKNATVTFDIKTPLMAFPEKIIGNEAISNSMFKDFHTIFYDVRSYYINTPLNLQNNSIHDQKWLVTMNERMTSRTRVGTGTYRWTFVEKGRGNWVIQNLHIIIQEMISFIPNESKWLSNIHHEFTDYPWVNHEQAIQYLSHEPSLERVITFIGHQ